jgi:hypothetical protein
VAARVGREGRKDATVALGEEDRPVERAPGVEAREALQRSRVVGVRAADHDGVETGMGGVGMGERGAAGHGLHDAGRR